MINDGGYRSGVDEDFVVEVEAFLLQLLVGRRGVCEDCLRAVRTSHVDCHAIGLVIVCKNNFRLRSIS